MYILDQLHVLVLNMEMNGANLVIVRAVTLVPIAILELNNNFTQKYINQPNVMMYNKLVIALVEFFVLLHMLTVYIHITNIVLY